MEVIKENVIKEFESITGKDAPDWVVEFIDKINVELSTLRNDKQNRRNNNEVGF